MLQGRLLKQWSSLLHSQAWGIKNDAVFDPWDFLRKMVSVSWKDIVESLRRHQSFRRNLIATKLCLLPSWTVLGLHNDRGLCGLYILRLFIFFCWLKCEYLRWNSVSWMLRIHNSKHIEMFTLLYIYTDTRFLLLQIVHPHCHQQRSMQPFLHPQNASTSAFLEKLILGKITKYHI